VIVELFESCFVVTVDKWFLDNRGGGGRQRYAGDSLSKKINFVSDILDEISLKAGEETISVLRCSILGRQWGRSPYIYTSEA
jgi:hypothetical protein